MSYTTVQLKATTVGGAGAAVGSVRKGISPAKLIGIQITYHGSAPGTTDIVLKNVLNGVESTLVTKNNNAVNIPLQAFVNKPINSTAAQVNTHVEPPVSGELLLEVAESDALTDAVIVTCILKV